eukprot:Gb_19970 [translate_table: standard]
MAKDQTELAAATPCPGFEGFEKRLEIEFCSIEHPLTLLDQFSRPEKSFLRSLPVSDLEKILRAAQCTIVAGLSNRYFDSYVLSESSLFVYPLKIIIKTCGTTQLLNSIPLLLLHAARLSLIRVCRCRYSRGAFLFPAAQPYPHTNFTEEVKFLDTYFGKLGSGSEAHVLAGGLWHVYSAVADHYNDGEKLQKTIACPNCSPLYVTLEVCMTGLDTDIASKFFKQPGYESAQQMTASSGIGNLFPNSQICDFAFDPCGYSMNSIEAESYSTIHITPEDKHSYASFEIMGYLVNLQDLIYRVASTFKPSTLSFSLYTAASYQDEGDYHYHHLAGYECKKSTRQTLPGGSVLYFLCFDKLI